MLLICKTVLYPLKVPMLGYGEKYIKPLNTNISFGVATIPPIYTPATIVTYRGVIGDKTFTNFLRHSKKV